MAVNQAVAPAPGAAVSESGRLRQRTGAPRKGRTLTVVGNVDDTHTRSGIEGKRSNH